MSDFQYDVKETNYYTFAGATLDGKAVQNGTPTPDDPVEISVIETVTMKCGDLSFPIDLNGNKLASLPSGSKDVITIDAYGNVTLIKQTFIEDYDGSNMGKWSIVSGTYPYPQRTDVGITQVPITANTALCSAGTVKSVTASNQNLGFGNNTRNLRFRPALDLTLEMLEEYFEENNTRFVLALGQPQTIALGQIDVSALTNILTEIPITFETNIETTSTYEYTVRTEYDVENPYAPAPGTEIGIPPVHFGQEWETYQNNIWEVEKQLVYKYQNEWHAVYTVYLGELMESGVFDWSRPELDWSGAAFDEQQYKRVCDYFNLRFKWREISILPIIKWFDYLRNKLVYELMPKYKPLYERVAEGVNPLAGENEYYKNRTIQSAYPETLLSDNADYITDGRDEEFQRIKEKGTADAMEIFAAKYKGVDELLLDELEILFIGMYTTNVNGL